MSWQERGVEGTAAVGVLDAVEIGRARAVHTGGKVDTADEANRARGQRGLIVAEESCRAGESHSKLVGVHGGTEVSESRDRRSWVAKEREDVPCPVSDCNCQRSIDGLGGILDYALHVGRCEGDDVDDRRRGGGRTSTAAGKCAGDGGQQQKCLEPCGPRVRRAVADWKRAHRNFSRVLYYRAPAWTRWSYAFRVTRRIN